MKKEITTYKYSGDGITTVADFAAVEEPLEISITYFEENISFTKNISVTMRTPGNDEVLAAGFLFTEGIINHLNPIKKIEHIAFDENKINVILHKEIIPLLQNTERNFYTTSSCGVCGKASIDAIKTVSAFNRDDILLTVAGAVLCKLPQLLQEQQIVFKSTGGLHAAALFTNDGSFIMLQEDVGRHNALDKIVGTALQQGLLPLSTHILLLSGRASFELVQKAVMAGIKIIAAIGAPSTLAIELADEAGITLVGFLKATGFNIYTHKNSVTG